MDFDNHFEIVLWNKANLTPLALSKWMRCITCRSWFVCGVPSNTIYPHSQTKSIPGPQSPQFDIPQLWYIRKPTLWPKMSFRITSICMDGWQNYQTTHYRSQLTSHARVNIDQCSHIHSLRTASNNASSNNSVIHPCILL